MNRRNLLSAVGLSAVAGLDGLSAATGSSATKRQSVVSLESFRVGDAEQMTQLHSYFGGTFLSYLSQVHRGPRMFLEAIVAPHTPQALVVIAFPNFDDMIQIRNKIASHPNIQRARAQIGSGESQILVTANDSLQFQHRLYSSRAGIFELRTYDAPTWRDQPPAAAHAAFRRAGIEPILNGSAAGEHLPRFTYLVRFENLAVRQEAWARLEADSEWSRLDAKVTGASIYTLAPYSPLS
jgi:hypothetical protein